MRMQQAAPDWRNLLPSAAKADGDAVKLRFAPKQQASPQQTHTHTDTDTHMCVCIYICLLVCVCRLQVFTISGARRRLYFALRGSTNIHTHTQHTYRGKYALICTCVCVHTHTYTSKGIVAQGSKAKKAANTHIHTYIYIHSLTRTLETMAVFLLYVAELTQRDTHAHRHTYTNRPNGRESESERAAGRPGQARPSAAVPCVRAKIKGGSCCICRLREQELNN